MIRKSLIALATVAAVATGAAATSEAKTFVSIDIGVPGFGFYGGGYGHGYHRGYCGVRWIAYKQWNWAHTFYRIKHRRAYVCY